MVQNRVQKQVQTETKNGGAAEGDRMPQFMFKTSSGTGYLFRRGVPEDVRRSIGKREFKKQLGGDYKAACRERDRLAYETTLRIEAARQGLANLRGNRFLVWDELEVIHDVTPELVQRFYSTVLATTEVADTQRRETVAAGQEPSMGMAEARESNEGATSLLRHALSSGDCSAFRHITHQTLHLNGYRLADELVGSLHEGKLMLAFVRAQLKGIGIVEARFNGDDPPIELPAVPLKRVPRSSDAASARAMGSMMLSDAVKDFLANRPKVQGPMNEKHGFILPAFVEVVGDMPITALRQAHVNEFLRTVQRLPPRWTDIRRQRNLSIRAIADESWEKCLSKATYDGTYLASLRTFIQRAVADWQDIGFPTTLTTDVPYQGSRTTTERKQRALRPDEIRAIFFNPRMEKLLRNPSKAHKFWLLAVELYTGARVREICQINPQSDFGCTNGIWWLRLTADPGPMPDPDVVKSIKTGRPRTIPMHAELVRIGLPDYLEQLKACGARRLFPQWAPTAGDAGSAPGKSVANYLRSIGLHGIANEVGNAVRGSHAFRHTLLTYGRKNGVNLRCISGHAEASDNRVADGYEDETVLVTLPDMAERLSKLNYGVELPVPVQALSKGA
ncbi:hypothetical protein FEP95_03290 [Burkholderia multivorans]|nr:hypothetical protein [Burkholderia multivorans]MDR8808222.1 hypothetical protein [Burkholderia multivorans]